MKCQICKDEEAQWAWQPFGPAETPDSFAFLGNHYRGFPVIKVGDVCKNAFQTGDFLVEFEYKGHHYIGKDHEVREVHITLYEEGTISPTDLNPSKATVIMKDASIGGPDLVALVFKPELVPTQPDLVKAFLVAPDLIEACEDLMKHASLIEDWASGLFYEKLRPGQEIRYALAKVRLALKAARGED
jgi:hypothetical protein